MTNGRITEGGNGMGDSYYLGTPLSVPVGEPQLLLDDTVVEDRWKLTRVMTPPFKHLRNPVLVRDKPWEGDVISAPVVIRDEEHGKYRMWYTCFSASSYFGSGGTIYYIAYAESDDGVSWEKPLLDVCSFPGFEKTNIVYRGSWPEDPGHYGAVTAQVFRDAEDPDPSRRYKMITYEARSDSKAMRGVSLACSPDGLRWRLAAQPYILDYRSDTGNHVVWDPRARRWLLYCRPRTVHATGLQPQDPVPGGLPGDRHYSRRIAVMASEDFLRWSYPRTCLYPDERDLPDYDWERVFRYGSHFLCLYGAMDGEGLGTEEVRLASSGDGFHWNRFHTREPYLARGREGDWDAGQTRINNEPVRQGEMLLHYYSGEAHGQSEWIMHGGIGLAVGKADRFVAQRADDQPGFLITREFVLEGPALRVNTGVLPVRYRDAYVRVEIVRHPALGQHTGFQAPIPGYTFADCDKIRGDRIDALVTWKGKPDLRPLVGSAVYVRFEIRNMSLYAFHVAGK